MHPHRLPGSDVNPILAAAFVISLILLLAFTSPPTSVTQVWWTEAGPTVHEQHVPAQGSHPAMEVPADVAVPRDGAVS